MPTFRSHIALSYVCTIPALKTTKANTHINGSINYDNNAHSMQLWILMNKDVYSFVSGTGLKTNFVE